MKRIYLAARYGRREELSEYAAQLRGLGFEVTSHWLNGEHEAQDQTPHPLVRRQFALEDWADLMAADTCIAFTEQPGDVPGRSRGGRHVELGAALASGHRILIVGPQENVFCCLPQVEGYATWSDALITICVEANEEHVKHRRGQQICEHFGADSESYVDCPVCNPCEEVTA